MHLTPHELDKLTLHQAGFLAQKRLARGVKLNHPEAVALIATQIRGPEGPHYFSAFGCCSRSTSGRTPARNGA